MNMFALTTLLLCFGDPQTTDIWKQVEAVETEVIQAVKQTDSKFGISATNPARGYYIPGKGVVMIVPLRYRSLNTWRENAEPNSKRKIGESRSVTAKDLQKRMAQWQEQQKAYELLRETHFQRVANAIKTTLPQLAKLLSAMGEHESLMVAVEEAPPAYYYANFSLKKNPTRRVITYTVGGQLFQLVQANKVERTDDWLSKVESTTTRRALAVSE